MATKKNESTPTTCSHVPLRMKRIDTPALTISAGTGVPTRFTSMVRWKKRPSRASPKSTRADIRWYAWMAAIIDTIVNPRSAGSPAAPKIFAAATPTARGAPA